MTAEDLRSLDLLVPFDDHHVTFSTHTILEATGMTRITFAFATALSLAFTPLAAQQTDCDGWNPSDWEVAKPFWEASSVDTVSDCLMSGADVNARNEDGRTPLHWAALHNENPEVFTVLLDAGADVNAKLEWGATPLNFVAAHISNLEVLTVLLDAGADVSARDKYGNTPLYRAAMTNDNLEVFTVLLDAGADVNARNEVGSTPLHYAASRAENPEVLILLLDAGADGTAVNDDGETPFDLAKDNEALASTDAYWALNDARFE